MIYSYYDEYEGAHTFCEFVLCHNVRFFCNKFMSRNFLKLKQWIAILEKY